MLPTILESSLREEVITRGVRANSAKSESYGPPQELSSPTEQKTMTAHKVQDNAASASHQSEVVPQATTSLHSAGVSVYMGQLRLDAPVRFSGTRKQNVRSWLVEMERWMRLMRYPEPDWIDILATRLDGTASTWFEKENQRIRSRQRNQWGPWEHFI